MIAISCMGKSAKDAKSAKSAEGERESATEGERERAREGERERARDAEQEQERERERAQEREPDSCAVAPMRWCLPSAMGAEGMTRTGRAPLGTKPWRSAAQAARPRASE